MTDRQFDRLERVLSVLSVGLLVSALAAVILLGFAREARAAGGAAAPLSVWLPAGSALVLFVLVRYWRPRALARALQGTSCGQRRTLRVIGWWVLAFFGFLLLLPGWAAAAGDGFRPYGGGFVWMNLWHFGVTLFYAVVAIGALFGVLRLRDKLLGVNFRGQVVKIIHRSAVAAAIYYGVWILAGALIIGKAFA